ncbi:MAG: MBL fold metallo-hydrolase [Candidatus Bathyarchaeia archaeon]|nr:MBL fold metallo-hydrolase [Candidatus Bathyarchaeia archaeon]MDI6904517.1 MBL fold metallo-hydrolase [Candidatus Bathyarchaeia archaeon]
MVSLTFYGGVDEIGGNKVLLEDKKARVFFDFGQSFTMGCEFFTGWLSPRAVNGLGDYFEFGLLPKLKGLYAEGQLRFTDVRYVKPRFDAVFLSHAHFDHVNHIQFLDPEIPVYLGEGTKLFLEAMEKTSGFCDYGEHRYGTFRTGDKVKVDGMVVEPVHVDHSIPAAYGFLIHTSEGVIVYTGDLRVHGPRKDLTEEFADKARECEPVAMICEGTRMVDVERRKNYSEGQVERLSGKIVSSTDKIVFVTRYSRDMDRFRSFYNVARNNGRKIVVSPKTAHLLGRLVEDKRLDLPDPLRDKDILVYFKRKKSGGFSEGDYYVWEREFMDKMVTHEFVHKNQSRLVMDLDFYQFAELIDIRPDAGSHFIHSMSEPFSEEDIEDVVMHNWLDHFKMRFHQLHASGHMNRKQITSLIGYIKPKKVFPIHTENQHLFKKLPQTVQTVECGKTYKLK